MSAALKTIPIDGLRNFLCRRKSFTPATTSHIFFPECAIVYLIYSYLQSFGLRIGA
jgi:hypothetical protein